MSTYETLLRTDHGTLPNLKWSFADSHMRLEDGGWARQTTVRKLPVSDTMAGVNMRLNRGAVREMHWHKASEWAYMLAGRARITAIDQEGRTFIDTSAWATCDSSPPASRIRSRASVPKDASSCSCSTTAASRRTTPSC